METRIERNRRLRRQKWKKSFKNLCILFLVALLIIGVKVVNSTIVKLNCIENPKILSLDVRNSKLDIFGRTYFIDFRILKKK